MGTLNVESSIENGTQQPNMIERKRMDILHVQETKCKSSKARKIKGVKKILPWRKMNCYYLAGSKKDDRKS